MPERDHYIPGVPCWVDTSQPDPAAAVDFYRGLFGWEFEDVMAPESGAHYFIGRLHGGDVAAVIEDHARDFGHIQIADNPGRGAPGTGGLPLGQWITRARELGYDGYIGLEYKAAQHEAFAWAIREPSGARP